MLFREPTKILNTLEPEASSKSSFNMVREGLYRAVLRASFIRCFEFAKFVHKHKIDKADEGAFFLAAALRGISESLIVLKFIRRLNRKDRDEVIRIKMMSSTAEIVEKQAAFFRQIRPFQPILADPFEASALNFAKDRLTAIGQSSQLWNTSRKLPPVEQMASQVHLKPFYNFIYAVTSEIVHFNVRIALRSGWGNLPRQVRFSTKNFCRYYLEFNQFYSLYLLAIFCRTFKNDLGFSIRFMKGVAEMRALLDDSLRWPEAVTFEEMNQRNPNALIRVVLKVAHLEKTKKRPGYKK
jgi:hypothetical protein